MRVPTSPPAPSGDPVVAPDAVPETVESKLKALGVAPDVIERIKIDVGADSVDDLAHLTEADLTKPGLLKPVGARRLLAALAASAAPVVSAAPTSMTFDVLPVVPDDASWLKMLQAGGVLKVDESTVIAAIRAALARQVSLFEIPGKLVEAMESFADRNEEPVTADFFALREELTRHSYAEIFSAVPGLTGSYVTEGRKKQLFQRIDAKLWPAILAAYQALKAWQESWMQGAANPAMLMSAIASIGNRGVGVMPPGMMAPPDTGVIRDQSAAMADAVNGVFAGTGTQIAAALAYEASRIRDALSNPRLPALVGAPNRDMMLRQLGVAVSATYPRTEATVTRFVLGFLQLQDQPAGNEELAYIGALYMLGATIPWEQLGSRGPTGIGGRNNGSNRL